MNDELIIPLENGGSLRCGPGFDCTYGGYLRICDDEGEELFYWSCDEWETQGDGELVIGAVFAVACKPLRELKK